MNVSHSRQLGQVGHAEHLLVPGHLGQLLGHLLGGPARNAGVHLVKDQGAHVVVLGQHIFKGQHDPGQLTARGDLLDGLQVLPHVGGHEEADGVHAVGVELVPTFHRSKLHPEPDFRHIQLGKLALDALLQGLPRLFSLLREALSQGYSLLQSLGPLLLQPEEGVVGKLDLVQLRLTALQIAQHLLHAAAVLFFQPVEKIQTALQLIQLPRLKVEGAGQVPGRVRRVLGLTAAVGKPLPQLVQLRADPRHRLQSPLGLHEEGHRPGAVLVPREGEVGALDRPAEVGGVAEDVPALVQGLLLPRRKVRPLQLIDLELEGIHPAGLLTLVHLEGGYFPVQPGQRLIGRPVGLQRPSRLPKAIQVFQMAALVQKLLSVMLAVDIQQLPAQSLQLGHRHRTTVDPADIFAVGHDLPLKEQFPVLIGLQSVFLQPGQSLHPRKGSADQRRPGSRTDQFPAGPLPGNGAHGVHHNGLARPRLAGEGVEAGTKQNVRRFNDGDIFDVKDRQHDTTPSCGEKEFLSLNSASPGSPRRTPPPTHWSA